MKKFFTVREWKTIAVLAVLHWVLSAAIGSALRLTETTGGPAPAPGWWQQLFEHFAFASSHADDLFDMVLELDSFILYYLGTAVYFFVPAAIAYAIMRAIVRFATKK